MGTDLLPLFPLGSVLFPGGSVGLRVFEARYLDLVRECGRKGHGFGICLLLDGTEVGRPGTPAAVGTEATIEDFDTDAHGLLLLRVRGGRRFRARKLRVRDNGLQVAEVRWADEAPGVAVRPEHAVLVTVLRHMLDREGGEHAGAPGACFNDAAWVAWRLAERLPLDDAARQALLQEDDPHDRLQRLLGLVS